MFVGVIVSTLDMNDEAQSFPNIVLTGFMGTGKSTVGRLLARKLGHTFLDLDELIEREAGMAIKDIFASFGEERFRELEAEAIERLAAGSLGTRLVVSTGGGAVVRKENRALLKGFGVLVCLTASRDEILRRVGNRADRPLLAGADREAKLDLLLEQRQEAYRECDLEVDTTGRRPEEVVKAIQKFAAGRAGA